MRMMKKKTLCHYWVHIKKALLQDLDKKWMEDIRFLRLSLSSVSQLMKTNLFLNELQQASVSWDSQGSIVYHDTGVDQHRGARYH